MNYETFSHRHAEYILAEHPRFKNDFKGIKEVLSSISDQDLIDGYQEDRRKRKNAKSLSTALNKLIRKKLVEKQWIPEAAIFRDKEYTKNKTKWRLDFTKNDISIEVAFNHGGDIAHNLMKPVLASQLNHVEKDNQTEIGIIICATDSLKKAGNFDSAIGPMEKFISYLKPYSTYLTVPILIIGLKPPKIFKIDSETKEIIYL